jgi:hypothetical protein
MKAALKAYVPYYLLVVVIMLPLWLPGYILTLDTVFVPHVAAPTTLGNDFFWQLFLHILNVFFPSQVIEKVIFTVIPLVAAVGMHRLVVRLSQQFDKGLEWSWAPYVGGIFYAVNPFTYDRFMAGQYGVLLGYALLPFVVHTWLAFVEKPGRIQMLHLESLVVILSIISIPTLGEFVLIALCVISVAAWQHRRDRKMLASYTWRSLGMLGLFLLLSSYWLVPFATGKGVIAGDLQQFSAAHTAAFATIGDNFALKAASVLRLQGFWAEPHRLFILPQDVLYGWGTVRLAIWMLIIAGAAVCWRRARPLAVALGVMGVGSVLLAAGLFSTWLTSLGYREPQKFTGLVALVFAVFMALGAARLASWAQGRPKGTSEAAEVGVFFIIFVFTPTMYWGFIGQLRPREYPAGWYTINNYLNQQQGSFETLFLPWHQYMSFAFAQRIIANPAGRFFDRPVTVSNNPELGKITPPAAAATTQIGQLVIPDHWQPDLAVQLAHYDVRYIILAKDYDYKKYNLEMQAPNLQLVRDTPSISLYENIVWKGSEE